MNYIEVTFDITPYEEAVADALISELGTIGYDGFSYTDQGFTAYIPAKEYNAQAITRLEIFDFFKCFLKFVLHFLTQCLLLYLQKFSM